MKIVSWNCNGALRNKFENIIALEADIYVIQECENPSETKHNAYKIWAENYLWIGDSKNKGVGVFAKKNIVLKKLDWSNLFKNHTVKHFLPCSVNENIQLLAVWTHQNNSPNFGYIGQLWKYLQVHKEKLNNALIVGDFNSNKIWDQWDRWWNHSDVVNELCEIGIESLYHKYTNENQGEETIPTFFLHRNLQKSYHIDYCFATNNLIKSLKKFEIGNYMNWKQLSDHAPLIVSFDLKT